MVSYSVCAEGLRNYWKFLLNSVTETLDTGEHQVIQISHCCLIRHEDGKVLTGGISWPSLPKDPERFDNLPFVLGLEGFTSGRHCWEVEVVDVGERWTPGVPESLWRGRNGLRNVLRMGSGLWPTGGVSAGFTPLLTGFPWARCPGRPGSVWTVSRDGWHFSQVIWTPWWSPSHRPRSQREATPGSSWKVPWLSSSCATETSGECTREDLINDHSFLRKATSYQKACLYSRRLLRSG